MGVFTAVAVISSMTITAFAAKPSYNPSEPRGSGSFAYVRMYISNESGTTKTKEVVTDSSNTPIYVGDYIRCDLYDNTNDSFLRSRSPGYDTLQKKSGSSFVQATDANINIPGASGNDGSNAWITVPNVGSRVAFMFEQPGTYKFNYGCYSGKSYTGSITFDVIPKPVELESLTVSPTSMNLMKGSTSSITTTKTPSNADGDITYTSSNTSVATVSNSGVVTARGAGTATITVKCQDISKTISIKVSDLTLSDNFVNIFETIDYAIEASKTYTDTPGDIKFASSDSSVVTITPTNNTGSAIVTGVSRGTANITITCGSVVKTIPVKVVTVGASIPELTAGETVLGKAECSNPEMIESVVWENNTGSPAITLGEKSGFDNEIIGQYEGEYGVRVYFNFLDSYNVKHGGNHVIYVNGKVNPAPVKPEYSLTPDNPTIEIGETENMIFQEKVDGTWKDTTPTWSIENEKDKDGNPTTGVATITPDGKVTGLTEGTATIKAEINGETFTTTVTITKPEIPPVGPGDGEGEGEGEGGDNNKPSDPADKDNQDKVDIKVDGTNATGEDSAGTSVNIEIEASRLTIGDGNTVSLNVPATLPILFAADGKNYLPTNWKITNNDPNTAIDLVGVMLEGNSVGGNTWTVTEPGTDMKAFPVNSTTMIFKMAKTTEKLQGISVAGNDVKWVIAAAKDKNTGNAQLFDFGVERTAFTDAATIEGAYTLNLTFDFHSED